MAATRPGVNAITAAGVELVLSTTGGGDAVHLVHHATPSQTGRGAVFDFAVDDVDTESSRILDYDRAALLRPCWAETTLCGREWAAMIGGETGPVQRYGGTAYAPCCRRCLALMDKLFPAPAEDPRLPLLTQIAADVIAEHGFCQVHHVPGDQKLALRTAIRANVKASTGHRIATTLIDATLYIHCAATYARHAHEYSRMAGEAVLAFLASPDGPLPPQMPQCHISWTAWNAG